MHAYFVNVHDTHNSCRTRILSIFPLGVKHTQSEFCIVYMYTWFIPSMYIHIHIYIHTTIIKVCTHVHSSCSAAWVLQLLCWKYSDLCTLRMYNVHVCSIQDTLIQTCNFQHNIMCVRFEPDVQVTHKHTCMYHNFMCSN